MLSLFQLKVTRPDGSPATGSKVRVTISRGWYESKKFYNKTFVVTNGLITDSIDDATYNARSLIFEVVQNFTSSKMSYIKCRLDFLLF